MAKLMGKLVYHDPVWMPADLLVNQWGETQPGFVCVYWLENGNGQCGGSVFDPAEAIGQHACVVMDDRD